jgi:Ca2+-binding EF-hand superfamily protein
MAILASHHRFEMKLLLLSLAVFCVALPACQTTPPDRFQQADLNRDGRLSREEVSDYLVTGVFASRDANGDKRMTREEWLAGEDPGQEKIFRERDLNRDGVVTLEEALEYGRKKGTATQLVREADKNKDGVLSREEVAAYYGSKEGSPR